MATVGCSHFKAYKSKTNLDGVIALLNRLIYYSSQEDREIRAKSGKCYVCSNYYGRLYACLYCVYIGCYNSKHIHAHAEQKDHVLAIDLNYGQIHCFSCNCAIYDVDVDESTANAWKRACKFNGTHKSLPIPISVWEPSGVELEYINENPTRLNLASNNHVGLRGLINLGSTCFMNCVLQAFVHTPMMRDYFLAGRHRCSKEDCLVCEIINLFQKFYTGEKNALIPDRLLHLMWTHARQLAGYEQQDAHEFSMASLDILRSQLGDSSENSCIDSQVNNHNCSPPGPNHFYSNHHSSTGIIDQIFYGMCQSDVTCQTCGHNSTTHEAFSDISLELPGSTSSPWHTAFSPPHSSNNSVQINHMNDSRVPISIQNCLERFTRSEHLGNKAFKCSRCNSYQESTKQLSILKTPPICCFHLKRFEHTSKARQKIDTFVNFPITLDMTPFTSSQLRNSESNKTSNLQPPPRKDKNLYSLYAVINHHGDLQCGHYSVFVRQQTGGWFDCNDHTILKTTCDEVLKSQAYLLFYHRKHLEYEHF